MESRVEDSRFESIAEHLSQVGREFWLRGWALGTSGNFSAVVTRDPLRLAITSTGIDKSTLCAEQIVEIREDGEVVGGQRRASAEALLHLMIADHVGADAILHTHSVWATVLSELEATQGGLALQGYEMLKGLRGATTHDSREWIPIIENSQDMSALSSEVKARLLKHPCCHGVLLRGHGLYTWGRDLAEAKRHVEILEFLLEVKGRIIDMQARGDSAGPRVSRMAVARL